MRNLAGLFLALGMVGAQVANADTPPADPCSNLKLEISIPNDAVHPLSEVLLETRLSNAGQDPVFLSGGEADWWSYKFDIRDSQGSPVPQTAEWQKALSERPQVVTLNVAIPIYPGAPRTNILMLDKLFDLSRPGAYTIRVSSFCEASNLVHFTVDAPIRRAPAAKPAIAIHAGTTASQVPAGWALPLDIVITNKGDRPVQWTMNDPPNTAPDESGMGVEVFDSEKKLVSASEHPYPDWSFGHFPYGQIELLKLSPGGSAEQIIAVGNLFDIGRPGRYTARIVLLDPITKQRVESNPVSFEVSEKASATPGHDEPRMPPFLVTLRSEPNAIPAGRIDSSNILICMSNISDHDVRLDNVCLKDFMTVEAPDGSAVTMTEKANREWDPDRYRLTPAGQALASTWNTVKPRKALCGGIGLGVIYDLRVPGAYRVRVDRYDEPDANPGQKLADLPIIHSNWLRFEKPASR